MKSRGVVAPKCVLTHFVCIAKRVTGHGVNSNLILTHLMLFPAYNIETNLQGFTMKNNCTNLYLLSTIACQLSECLDETELEMLSADLTALGYMMESLLAHQSACKDD